MDAPSLEVSKARLDGALSILLWWKLILPMAGGWNQIFQLPSNPHHSVLLDISKEHEPNDVFHPGKGRLH